MSALIIAIGIGFGLAFICCLSRKTFLITFAIFTYVIAFQYELLGTWLGVNPGKIGSSGSNMAYVDIYTNAEPAIQQALWAGLSSFFISAGLIMFYKRVLYIPHEETPQEQRSRVLKFYKKRTY